MQESQPAGTGEWRRNWPLLAAATAALSFGAVPVATLGIFMQPLQDAFGWSRTTITFGLMVFAFVTTPLSPFAGALVDKFGARAIGVPGLALAGISFAAFSLVGGSFAMWVTAWIVYSLCALLIRSTVWNRAVAGAFEKSRGLAIAVLLTGTSIAGAIAPIVTHLLIDNVGWEGAYIGLGIGWAGIGWVLVLLFFREPQAAPSEAAGSQDAVQPKELPGGLTGKEALRNPVILRIGCAVLIQTTISAAVSVHLVPIHTSLGASRGEAAGIVALMGVGAVIAKLASGVIADRVRSSVLPLVAFTLPALGYLLLLLGDHSILSLATATFIIGCGSGAALHMIIYLTTQYGGLRNFGKIYGSIGALMGLAAGIGPVAAGMVHDANHSYDMFITAAIPMLLVAGLLVFGLGPYPDFKTKQAPSPS
ncbi:MAG: MFS transporter [Novosphingobium sp.]|nr:MFS transporter [Novosphingobium sp.]